MGKRQYMYFRIFEHGGTFDDGFYWEILNQNKRVVCVSEHYASRKNALRGIKNFLGSIGRCELEELK